MGEKSPISATTEIAAPAEKVYAMVTDLPRMGEWSPDNRGGDWKGGAAVATPGAVFKGRNQNGKKKWSGVVKVTDVTIPSRFAFTTIVGPMQIGTWSYDIEPTATGCKVTESWVDKRNPVFSLPILGKLITGVSDRPTHNKAAMETTLANLKKSAES
ncbi:SRPBCC family protein [Sporichthya sp.]|uniref:SRPBCC family protein n=1 Tax=Sporichthya sp. TaxID=65475 RepID=UPI0017F00970|nr:SRPBCC family protein [Sporichthya sp.]MBA3744199.1 SRPBCC family protein [Sporichthya sp.]